MKTTLDLIKALGRQNMQDRLGITSSQGIYNRAADGHFPPSWFLILSDLAQEVGVECPASLFAFKTPSTKSGLGGIGSQGADPAPIPKDSEQAENGVAQ